MKTSRPPIVGITIGDVNGIGAEVIVKALEDGAVTESLTPVIYGAADVVSFYSRKLDSSHFTFTTIGEVTQCREGQINVLNCWQGKTEIHPGAVRTASGQYAWKALARATADWTAGKIAALVTAPINKLNIQNEAFKFPGHTEYLTDRSGAEESLMLMVSEAVRVGVVSGHIPLREVSEAVTQERIIQKVKLMSRTLKQDFGVIHPRIAVLGLNPHAGEEGMLGKEEIDTIRPAIAGLQATGEVVTGPYPADGFFASGAYRDFDAVMAMYHDQGLIPFKSLSAGRGVNFTAGLPFVRTSPDHGTAYALAGKNQARSGAMRAAIDAAMRIADAREAALFHGALT